jgi:hypothetical protein
MITLTDALDRLAEELCDAIGIPCDELQLPGRIRDALREARRLADGDEKRTRTPTAISISTSALTSRATRMPATFVASIFSGTDSRKMPV